MAGPRTISKHFSNIVIGKAGATTSNSAAFCKTEKTSGDIETSPPPPPFSVLSPVINNLQYVTVWDSHLSYYGSHLFVGWHM
jgi:hypothetical protein